MILKYTIAITSLLGWSVGYLCFNTGKEIHLLLGMAVMASSVIIMGEDGLLNKKLNRNNSSTAHKAPIESKADDTGELKSIILNTQSAIVEIN